MEILFATSNDGKTKELKKFLPNTVVLKTLDDFPEAEDVEETENSYEGNSLLKADYLQKLTNLPVLSDDSGIEIDGLFGFKSPNEPFPSIFSARAFSDHDADKNNQGVIEELKKKNLTESDATYICCLCYKSHNSIYYFKSEMKGKIYTDREPRGENGFAYDTIFYPILQNGQVSKKSYAEMTDKEKNKYSHRIQSIRKLLKEKDLF